jgi:hypothetical protein
MTMNSATALMTSHNAINHATPRKAMTMNSATALMTPHNIINHATTTTEGQLLKVQRDEAIAELDREHEAAESKLEAAETEIEELTQRVYVCCLPPPPPLPSTDKTFSR